jgi:NO-binding membrane sensor protein with MHYT domain
VRLQDDRSLQLVLLSLAVAVVASYTALDLAGRVSDVRERPRHGRSRGWVRVAGPCVVHAPK